MAPKAPAETHQTTEVKLPDWVESASKSNYDFAKKVAGRKMPVYKGPRVADQSTMTTDAYKYMMDQVGAQDPLYENAAAIQGRAATELDPIYGKAQGILSSTAGPWDVEQYLNPYTNEVESRAIANAQRDLDRSLMSASDRARAAGAFGGSASAIEKGVLAAEGSRGIGDLSAELRAAGYDKATSDLLSDRASKQAAANSMIAGAGAQGSQWLEAAKGLLGTATSRGAQVATDVSSMLTAGANEQAYRQSLIDADRQKFEEKQARPLERLNILLSALGMSPYGKTEETTKTATSESPGPDFATMGLGILQALPALFSDRDAKTDIEKLGKDPETGLDIYAYRYKKDPKHYPKVVGPMAQDIEKLLPGSTHSVGGHLTIRPGILGRAA